MSWGLATSIVSSLKNNCCSTYFPKTFTNILWGMRLFASHILLIQLLTKSSYHVAPVLKTAWPPSPASWSKWAMIDRVGQPFAYDQYHNQAYVPLSQPLLPDQDYMTETRRNLGLVGFWPTTILLFNFCFRASFDFQDMRQNICWSRIKMTLDMKEVRCGGLLANRKIAPSPSVPSLQWCAWCTGKHCTFLPASRALTVLMRHFSSAYSHFLHFHSGQPSSFYWNFPKSNLPG